MFLLRRTAARAIGSTPTKTFFAKPRSITTYTPAFVPKQQQWTALSFQKRFASDEAMKEESSSEAALAETAAETAVSESTPAPEATPAPESTPTADVEALEAASGIRHVGQAEGSTRTREFLDRKTNDRKARQQLAEPNTTLYVGNLYYEVTEEQLEKIFSRFGAVKSVKIVSDNRGMSRGFAYVVYENLDDAKSALENLDMQTFEGRTLVVQYHKPRENVYSGKDGKSAPTKSLFIGNMSFDLSDKDLNDLFRNIRNIMDVRVAIDRRTGQPRGFAHADFIDVDSAVEAMKILDNKELKGRNLRVDYAKESPKKDQRQRTEKTDTVTEE